MIELTAFGAIFLPLLTLALASRSGALAVLLPLAAVLQAPAVGIVVIGGARHGITPFNATTAAMGLALMWNLLQNPERISPLLAESNRTLWPYFFLFSAFAALLLPWLFGEILINPLLSDGDIHPARQIPNNFSLSHLAQAINSLGLLVILLYLLSHRNANRLVQQFQFGLLAAFGATILIGLFQRGAMLGAYPMAAEFWGSNPTYTQWFFTTDYGPSFGRAALPFIEPSYASAWFAAIICGAWTVAVYARNRSPLFPLIVLVLALGGLCNTLGTSGFAVVLLFGCAFLVHFVVAGCRRPPHRWRLVLCATTAALTLGAVAAMDYQNFRLPELRLLRDALEFTFEKTRDFNQNPRFLSNVRAVEIFFETYGLGAGPGGTRASSYLLALLANGGLVGITLFSIGLLKTFLGSRNLAATGDAAGLFALGGICGILLAVALAISDQNWPVLWTFVLFGVCCARISTSGPERPNDLPRNSLR